MDFSKGELFRLGEKGENVKRQRYGQTRFRRYELGEVYCNLPDGYQEIYSKTRVSANSPTTIIKVRIKVSSYKKIGININTYIFGYFRLYWIHQITKISGIISLLWIILYFVY